MRIKELRQLQKGEEFELTAMVTNVSQERTQNGSLYLKVDLQDSSGSIPARVWDNVETLIEVIRKGNVVNIQGKVDVYRGEVQLTIEHAFTATGFRLEDIYPGPPRPIDEMEEELNRIIISINSPHLRQLLKEILIKSEYRQKFLKYPAARKIHHAYIGGLLHHTLTVTKLLDYISRNYPGMNRDILLTGGILHDIGKLEELEIKGGFGYTDIGKLMGHIYLGAEIVEKFASRVKGLTRKDILLIKHIILSHHGSLEYGSPVLPKTPEAIAVHFVENMDAKLNHSINLITAHLEESREGAWTDYSYAMRGEIFISERADVVEEREKPDEIAESERRLFDD